MDIYKLLSSFSDNSFLDAEEIKFYTTYPHQQRYPNIFVKNSKHPFLKPNMLTLLVQNQLQKHFCKMIASFCTFL